MNTAQHATLACLLEVTAPKPGNVHRGADFDDAGLNDFVASAVAIGPAMAAAPGKPVGETVFAAVQATREVTATNTNLGTILLLAPLAAVPTGSPLEPGVGQVLRGLDADDAQLVYEAIRLASPGGLGEADEMDVAQPPPDNLLPAMQAAADRDLVARQYVTEFRTVFEEVVPLLVDGRGEGWPLPQAIVRTQITLIARHGDSLVARKCGDDTSQQAAARAARVLDAGRPGEENYHRALADFDFWLRSDGHRRNPGTTADLIAAGLFACLRDGRIGPPYA